MNKIKICGLRRQEDIAIVNRYRPDFIGFVFSKSPRRIDFDQARMLKSNLDAKIQAVGVFVNEPIERIEKLCRCKVIDMVQLHGDEDAEYIRLLRSRISCNIMKAVRVQSAEQVLEAEKTKCDFLLLDAYCKDKYGGSGESFNWDKIPKELTKAFFLAGGIHTGNVEKAIKQTHPFCVDVSSSVETDGYKDKEKIKAMIELVRSVS